MSEPTTLYKILDEDGACYHGGHGRWHLPTEDAPGEWMPEISGTLEPCRNGYHLCRATDLLNWLGPVIYIAEYDGERIDVDELSEGKVVVRRARLVSRVPQWNAQTARLFACDCAEHALLRERERGREPDPRSWASIEVARRFARGEATQSELAAAGDAARAAARAAAGAAAGDAAGDAAWAAAGAAAGAAAWDAARAAAWDAARAADWAAAWAAERQWQHERLQQYLAGQVAGVHS